MNKAFCPAPWLSLFVEPSGRVDNCCVAKNDIGNINVSNTVQEIVFSDKNNSVKQNMLQGIFPKGCKWCDNPDHSLQKRMLDLFPNVNDPLYSQEQGFKLKYLDARWSNTCNLACTYCSPTFSSQWAYELNQPQKIEKHSKQYLLDYVLNNVTDLEEVYMAGGEPLMMKENELLVDAISKYNPNCHVLVNTNLTQIKENKIFEQVVQLPNSSWLISFEERFERFEYIRYPAKWSQFEENFKILIDRIDVNKIALNMVYTSLNAVTIWDSVDWALEQGILPDGITLALYNNGVYQGPLDVRHMPLAYQNLALERMNRQKYQNLRGFNNIKNHLNKQVTHTDNSLWRYLSELDQRRNLNSKQIFPEIYQYKETP